MNCLICQKPTNKKWNVENKPAYSYFRCDHCQYLFMDPEQRLTPAEEADRYLLHENQATEGYVAYFKPLIDLIESHRSVNQKLALDYGSGPDKVLADLLTERSWEVTLFDPLFKPDTKFRSFQYDLITSTEVFEHLRDPHLVLKDIKSLIKPQGLVALMTSAYGDFDHFKNWFYRRDPTHIGFFNETTMKYIASYYDWKLLEFTNRCWIFQTK